MDRLHFDLCRWKNLHRYEELCRAQAGKIKFTRTRRPVSVLLKITLSKKSGFPLPHFLLTSAKHSQLLTCIDLHIIVHDYELAMGLVNFYKGN
jgi:hypothetical protein